MTDAAHRNDYGFGPWLDARSSDWYDDDPFLHELLDRYAPDTDTGRVSRFGRLAAGPLRELAEDSALPEHAPWIRHLDAYDRRRDDIVLPASTHEALRIVHGGEGLGAVRGDPFTHYAMIYLLAQNGEGGVACSLACTDGLVRALAAAAGGSGNSELHERALRTVRESTQDAYAHAAQFVTEIQGGSDVPANQVLAISDTDDGGAYRIHGKKWFCSNINADWFLVTARPGATDKEVGPVGLFLVPAFTGGARNGYTVDRLKDKLGTRELATAEVTFDGARAWPVGAPDRGLAHLLRYVLTPSRFACAVFAAGAIRRAERIATDYAEFREAFGRPIARYPLVQRALDTLGEKRRHALTVCFELLRLWEAAEASGYREREAVDFRILLSLAKPVLTRTATTQLHEAMMVLAGNGIEERFSPLPRLYRDSVIMETWEGPHNVLFTQALRDLRRFDPDPEVFLERVTGTPHPELARELQRAMEHGATEDSEATLAMADIAPAIIQAIAIGRGGLSR
jgi:alkylation response protein AidB-like acyl-CoA dehydrogenase